MAVTGLLHDGALQLGASHGEAVRSILAIAAVIAIVAALAAASALTRKQAPE
jgi:hypothetical protein